MYIYGILITIIVIVIVIAAIRTGKKKRSLAPLIEGRNDEKILIGFLSVFDVLQTLILLDLNYNGPTFSKGYYQDLLSNTHETYTPPSLPLSRDDIIKLVEKFDPLKIFESYSNKLFDTLDKSRLYPIQREIRTLIDILPSRVEITDTDGLARIFNALMEILEKYGFSKFFFKNLQPQIMDIDENSDNITYLSNLSHIFNIMILYFRRSGVNFDIFEILSGIIS
jgi:hypothetical protein